jgi:hypothetical protein
MKIIIVIHNPHKAITRIAHDAADINGKVYETLTKYGIDEKEAIECASWCELASYGESYNEDNFSVYIEEE